MAGLVPGSRDRVWTALWVPVIILAHAFSVYWLIKAFLTTRPAFFKHMRQRIRTCLCCGAGGTPEDAGCDTDGHPPAGSVQPIDHHVVPMPIPRPEYHTEQSPSMLRRGATEPQPHPIQNLPDPKAARRSLHQSTRVLLEWKDVSCAYPTGQGTKHVLQGVFGSCGPGDMLALLGPSGSGKSTLLDILAMRKSTGALGGTVTVNGAPRVCAEFLRLSAYVPQDNYFMPILTASEVVDMAADFLLPQRFSNDARRQQACDTMEAMGLSKATNTLVGGNLPGGLHVQGLSGGERKRLAIAAGIVGFPSLLHLDEPTSGLDAYAALSVMQYMRVMADSGLSVIASVHQPRSAIWSLFNKCLVLSQGREMYFGPRAGLIPWFNEELLYSYDPAFHGVPSDWVMDLVNISFAKPVKYYGKMMNTHEELSSAADSFAEMYKEKQGNVPVVRRNTTASIAPVSRRNTAATSLDGSRPSVTQTQSSGPSVVRGAVAAIAAATAAQEAPPAPVSVAQAEHVKLDVGVQRSASSRASQDALSTELHTANWGRQVRVLLTHEYWATTRNPTDVAGRTLLYVWVAMVIGIIYYNLDHSFEALRSRADLLWIQSSVMLLVPYVYMSIFAGDKQFYMADIGNKLYSVSAYYTAKVLMQLPFSLFNMCAFGFTVYGMAGGEHNVEPMFASMLVFYLLYLLAAQVMYCAAVVTPNQDMAFLVGIGWTAVNILMSGFLVRFVEATYAWVPKAFRWFSALFYGLEALAALQFSGKTYNCSEGFGTDVLSYLPAFLPNTTAVANGLVSVSDPARNSTMKGRNGTICARNGTVCARNGTICGRKCTICARNGTICARNGTICGRNGTICGRSGTICARNGTIGARNGTICGATAPSA
ncbi:MAG: hypothetical protein WDW38_001400 [Sanguina aurantia]